MKPLSSPQPLSSLSSLILLSLPCPLPSHHLLCLYPFTLFWHTVIHSHFVSFLPSFHPPVLRAAVPDSPVVDLFPVWLLFLVFASSISAKPVSPPLPQQNRWWIDPVRVRMGIVLGVYMCQGVYICVRTQVCVCVFPHVHMWQHKHACGVLSVMILCCCAGAVKAKFGLMVDRFLIGYRGSVVGMSIF